MNSYLLRLVAKNKFSDIIQTLTRHFESKKNLEKLKEITLISNKYERFQDERKKGEQTTEKMDLAYTKITNSLMDLITSLEENDLTGLKEKVQKITSISEEGNAKSVDTKTKEIAKWLDTRKPAKAKKIAHKVVQLEAFMDIDEELLTFDLVNVFLVIGDAVERNNFEILDYPEEIFLHYLGQKNVCSKALELLYEEIPPRFDTKLIKQTHDVIEYLKGRIISY